MPQNDKHWLNNIATWVWKVRLGEKETLESILRFFDDRIERLSDLEYYQVRPDSIFHCVVNGRSSSRGPQRIYWHS